MFAPIASFRMTFPFAVLFSVLLVTLMCVNQIRRRLVPLKQLRDGTQRIAERDFDVEISIDSGDEFQELADSFNAMARRLEEQFDSLATLIDIDRAILSAIDRDKVVDTLIARLRELYPCDSVAVSLVDPGAPAALRTQFSRESDAGSRAIEAAGFTAVEERQLGANSESLLVDLGRDAPRYLEPHVRIGMRQCLLLPLFVGSELAGVVSLGHQRAGAHDAKRLVYARQLADQTATALANVQTIEENRVLAYYDRLTGLPNRLLFKERLEQAVVAARRHREPIAICVFDIDGFKRINDTFGHDVGDLLIKQVADRVSRFIPAASLARIGGDQFGVLLTDLSTVDDPARVAKRILDAIAEPFSLPEQDAFLTASIGIAMYPDDGLDVDDLLRNADAAMYHAKDQGGNNFKFYTRAMNATAFRRLELENDLRRAHRARRAQGVLPAHRRRRHAAARRRGGARAMAASEDGPDPSVRVHLARRGDRPDRRARQVGARDRLRTEPEVAGSGLPTARPWRSTCRADSSRERSCCTRFAARSTPAECERSI